MKISDLKKIKMSHLSIIKTFVYYDDFNDDNIKLMLREYEAFLEKMNPKIDWIGKIYGDDVGEKESFYTASAGHQKMKISMGIPYIKTYFEPEIYNTYEEFINERGKNIDIDEVKDLKPNDCYDMGDYYVIRRDKYGRWIYQDVDDSTNTKYFYAEIEAEYGNEYFMLNDIRYKTLYDAHKEAMRQLNTLKDDALSNELVLHDFNEKEFYEKADKSAEEAGLKEVYYPEYDKQQDLGFNESIRILKGIL